MTREENLHWLNQEIRTWENECQSKHPIKEALYAARKALEQKPCEDAIVFGKHHIKEGRKMAMTIDDDIEMLEYIHKNYRGCRMGVALENTIDNLREYQTIQKIVKSWEGDSWTDGISEDCMEKISEVMKDGNYD